MSEKIKKYLLFIGITTAYCLLIFLLKKPWLYFGVLLICDGFFWHYIFLKSKKIKIKKSWQREWFDAIIFAVIAAMLIRTFLIEAYTIPTSSMEKTLLVGDFLFVSKINYGPRVPNTPIAFPFVHNKLPFLGNKSFIESIQVPYKRLKGFQKVERNDIVVFNYPMDDHYPVDKRENYIKRCVAIPGDTFTIDSTLIYINGAPTNYNERTNKQFIYEINTNGIGFSSKQLQKKMGDYFDIGINGDIKGNRDSKWYFQLTKNNLNKIKSFPNVNSITPLLMPKWVIDHYNPSFPTKYQNSLKWNTDYYGPIYIPKKGDTIILNKENIQIFERLITIYENNQLEWDEEKITINGNETNKYITKMNYYWMMGDNRHNSQDSRYWGYVPEDHVLGKPIFIWMSWDKNAQGFKKIRWDRLFTTIHGEGKPKSYFPYFIVFVLLYYAYGYYKKKSIKT